MDLCYQIIFVCGLCLTVFKFLLGGFFDGFNNNRKNDYEGKKISKYSFLKPSSIYTFLTVFGGIGLMGEQLKYNQILVFAISLVIGLFISFLIYRFIYYPLIVSQNTSSHSQSDLIGFEAEVLETILENDYGSVVYIVNGNKLNSPAKSVNGEKIDTKEKVIIKNIKDNVFYVDKKM